MQWEFWGETWRLSDVGTVQRRQWATTDDWVDADKDMMVSSQVYEDAAIFLVHRLTTWLASRQIPYIRDPV